MTPAQLRMLRRLKRWNDAERAKHGEGNDWIELSEIVMDQAACYRDGLAWRRADRTVGVLLRLGMIERHEAPLDDLVRVSGLGLTALEQQAPHGL